MMALLSLGLNFYTFSRLTEAVTILGAVDVGLNEKNDRELREIMARLDAVEAELKATKAAAPSQPRT